MERFCLSMMLEGEQRSGKGEKVLREENELPREKEGRVME